MQQINLYHISLKKKLLLFSFQRLLHASIALVFLLGFIQTYNEYNYYSAQIEFKGKTTQLTESTKRFNTLQTNLPMLKKDPSLTIKLNKLEQDIINKQLVLTILSDKKLGNTEGFTKHFEGLARQSINGLWITRAHFIEGGTILDIQGKSRAPELVPKYLQGLSSESAFKGSEFNDFVIQKNAKTKLHEFKFNNIKSSQTRSNVELTKR